MQKRTRPGKELTTRETENGLQKEEKTKKSRPSCAATDGLWKRIAPIS